MQETHYYLDGYNCLFSMQGTGVNLHLERTGFLALLRKCVAALKLNVTIVFDSSVQEQSTRGTLLPLECVYTSQHETADDYLLSVIKHSRLPARITLVTSDNALAVSARHYGAGTIEVTPFLNWLSGRYAKVKHKERIPLVKAAIEKIPPIKKPPSQPSAPTSHPHKDEELAAIFEKRYETFCAQESLKPQPATQPSSTKKAQKTLKLKGNTRETQEKQNPLESDTARWERIFQQKLKENTEET